MCHGKLKEGLNSLFPKFKWLHGQSGNPLYEIARHHGLVKPGFEDIIFEDHKLREKNISRLSPENLNKSFLLRDMEVRASSEPVVFVTQSGKKISTEFAHSVYSTLTKVISSAESLAHGQVNKQLKEDRVADYVYDKYVEIVRNELGKDLLDSAAISTDEAELRQILHGLFLMRIKREHIRSGCSNLFNLSLRNFSCYTEFKGHSYVELSKGFWPVIEAAIGKNKTKLEARVRLRHFLKRIILSSELVGADRTLYDRADAHSRFTNDKKKVVLIVCDASDPKQPKDLVVICDQVLCTMSLGFLKVFEVFFCFCFCLVKHAPYTQLRSTFWRIC